MFALGLQDLALSPSLLLGLSGLLFLLGLVVGSFLNVVIYRTVHGDQFVSGRSRCPHCSHVIAWYDNIPLLSFILLGKKCRSCHKPISWTYPVVEVLTGLLFVWWFVIGFTFFQLSIAPFVLIQPLFWLFVGAVFIVIFFADLLYYIIPDSMVASLTIAALSYRIALTHVGVFNPVDFTNTVIGAASLSLGLFALFVLTKGRGLGFGDVKLMFPLGLLMGWPSMLAGIWLSFVIGGVVGVMLLVSKKKSFGQIVPFGPFLLVGTMLALWQGDLLIQWYLGFL